MNVIKTYIKVKIETVSKPVENTDNFRVLVTLKIEYFYLRRYNATSSTPTSYIGEVFVKLQDYFFHNYQLYSI